MSEPFHFEVQGVFEFKGDKFEGRTALSGLVSGTLSKGLTCELIIDGARAASVHVEEYEFAKRSSLTGPPPPNFCLIIISGPVDAKALENLYNQGSKFELRQS